MSIRYGEAIYNMTDAALASGFERNTLRSLYGRDHFRIVGGEAKKGRGMAAALTLEDIMAIAVAKVAIDAGVHPRIAFNAAVNFAYTSAGAVGPNTSTRLPSQMFAGGFTVMIIWPKIEASEIVNMNTALDFSDVFRTFFPRPAAVVILLNDIERQVFAALDAIGKLVAPE